MNDAVDARDFGKLEAEVAQLKDLIEEMRKDMKDMKADWDTAKGGTKVLFVIATIFGGAVTAFVHWALGRI